MCERREEGQSFRATLPASESTASESVAQPMKGGLGPYSKRLPQPAQPQPQVPEVPQTQVRLGLTWSGEEMRPARRGSQSA